MSDLKQLRTASSLHQSDKLRVVSFTPKGAGLGCGRERERTAVDSLGLKESHKIRKHREDGLKTAAICRLRHGYLLVKIHDKNVMYNDPLLY